MTNQPPDSPSSAEFSSDVWLATGIMTAVPASLCLEGGRLRLALPNGDVVFDVEHAEARATFSALHFDAAFSVVVADETFRISLVAPLPDPAGIGAARRIGRRWRSLLASDNLRG
jgi:hypothetical protein